MVQRKLLTPTAVTYQHVDGLGGSNLQKGDIVCFTARQTCRQLAAGPSGLPACGCSHPKSYRLPIEGASSCIANRTQLTQLLSLRTSLCLSDCSCVALLVSLPMSLKELVFSRHCPVSEQLWGEEQRGKFRCHECCYLF